MRGERYPKYKPTGIAWLPEVPEGWEWMLNQFLFKENIRVPSDRDVPLSLSQADGLIPTDDMKEKSLKTSTYDGWKQVWVGDLVLNRFKAHLGVFFASKYKGMVSFHYGVFARRRDLLPQYYEYLYHTPQYKFVYSWVSKGMTVGLQNLSNTDFYKVRSPYPPVDTQRAIVAYLDEKCGKVDRLVAAKEKEAALLKELKQSMIAEAVTHGVRKTGLTGFTGLAGAKENPVNPVNPVEEKRRLVPSGIPWLPEVPEGWKVKKVRQLAREGKTKNKGNVEKNVLSLSYGRIIRKKDVYSGLVPTDFATYQIVEKNYVVLRLTDLQNDHKSLRCGLVRERGIITSAYVSLVPQNLLPEYLYLALHACDLNKVFYSMGGGLRQSMNFADVGNIFVPLPPLVEQREIVAHIEARAAKIDAAVKGLEREVAVLKEYKQRLIADVVTGQRKVA